MRKNTPILAPFVFVLISYFYPALVCLAYRANINFVDEKSILGVEIRTAGEWYPFLTSKSQMGKLILKSSSPPTVIYMQINWTSPWIAKKALVSFDPKFSNIASANIQTKIFNFAWGDAYLVGVKTNIASNTNFIVIPRATITVSGSSVDFINSIQKITAETK